MSFEGQKQERVQCLTVNVYQLGADNHRIAHFIGTEGVIKSRSSHGGALSLTMNFSTNALPAVLSRTLYG